MDALDKTTSAESGSALELSATETCVVVRGDFGHDDWKLVRDACDIARRSNHPLVIDLSRCTEVSRWGIGVILKARERAGSVFLQGCSDRVTYYFDGLGICGVCGRRSNSLCIEKRNALRPLSVQEFNACQAGRAAGGEGA